ncbi:MAG: PilN domain-containing protein [Patescibacteria group bacterium]|nr:PilN domain-containing protein [Patescibacteria group bacterium]
MEININLLPPEQKDKLRDLRIVGIIFKIGTTALFSLGIFWIFLQFCNQAIIIQKNVFDKGFTQFTHTDSFKEVQKSQNEIKQYSKQAKQIRSGLIAKNSCWNVINEINCIIPDDVYLKKLSIYESEEEEETLKLNGFAFHRQSLLLFEKKLKENEMFTNVESPISNLVMNENISFEFKAVLKK